MLSRGARLSTVAVCSALFACQNTGPRRLHDSEGRTFEATCPKDAACSFVQKSGPRRTERPAQALLVGSRLVGICDVTAGGGPEGPFDCRPLGCDSDADCPPLHGMQDGQCLNHHCGDAAESIGVQDSIMLCLAGTGLGRETPAQIERYALALNCGSPCTVPAPCQQP
jgi:hypothetical protein